MHMKRLSSAPAPCLLQKHDLAVKLVSGPIRSGKGKKKAEKAARLFAREAARASFADDTMTDAPKATKGLKAAKAKAGAGNGVTAMEADS